MTLVNNNDTHECVYRITTTVRGPWGWSKQVQYHWQSCVWPNTGNFLWNYYFSEITKSSISSLIPQGWKKKLCSFLKSGLNINSWECKAIKLLNWLFGFSCCNLTLITGYKACFFFCHHSAVKFYTTEWKVQSSRAFNCILLRL